VKRRLARDRPPNRERPAPVSEATGVILRLQQAAGNQAVARLLQRQGRRYRVLEEGLTLDPEIEAEMRRRGLFLPPTPETINLRDPEVIERVEGRGRPGGKPLPKQVEPGREPIVPQGEGPQETREGGVGDVWDAVKQVPLVKKGLDKLEEEAKRRWRKLRGK
jgi:hypothetical protein